MFIKGPLLVVLYSHFVNWELCKRVEKKKLWECELMPCWLAVCGLLWRMCFFGWTHRPPSLLSHPPAALHLHWITQLLAFTSTHCSRRRDISDRTQFIPFHPAFHPTITQTSGLLGISVRSPPIHHYTHNGLIKIFCWKWTTSPSNVVTKPLTTTVTHGNYGPGNRKLKCDWTLGVIFLYLQWHWLVI